jgi:hypothetical protein
VLSQLFPVSLQTRGIDEYFAIEKMSFFFLGPCAGDFDDQEYCIESAAPAEVTVIFVTSREI